MILMVSVQNLPEALEAIKGGADIVDVKNLQEALVGSAHPKVVKEVREAVPLENHASVTLGVVPNQSGTVAMAAYTAGVLKHQVHQIPIYISRPLGAANSLEIEFPQKFRVGGKIRPPGLFHLDIRSTVSGPPNWTSLSGTRLRSSAPTSPRRSSIWR